MKEPRLAGRGDEEEKDRGAGMLPCVQSRSNHEIAIRDALPKFIVKEVEKAAAECWWGFDPTRRGQRRRFTEIPHEVRQSAEFKAVFDMAPGRDDARRVVRNAEGYFQGYELGLEPDHPDRGATFVGVESVVAWREQENTRLSDAAMALPAEVAMQRLVDLGFEHIMPADGIVSMLLEYLEARTAALPEWRDRWVYEPVNVHYQFKEEVRMIHLKDSEDFDVMLDAMPVDDVVAFVTLALANPRVQAAYRAKKVESIGERLGMKIVGLFQFGRDNPEYAVVLPPQQIIVVGGVEDLARQATVRTKLMRSGNVLQVMTPEAWAAILRDLLDVAEVRDDPTERPATMFTSAIEYMRDLAFRTDRREALQAGEPFEDDQGHYVPAMGLSVEQRQELKRLGYKPMPQPLSFRDASGTKGGRRYWFKGR